MTRCAGPCGRGADQWSSLQPLYDLSPDWQLPIRDLLSSWHFLRKHELGVLEFLHTAADPRRKRYGDLELADPGMLLAVLIDAVAKYRTHVRTRQAWADR